MKTGLYFKTKLSVCFVVAILAILAVAALGLTGFAGQTQSASVADLSMASAPSPTQVADKVITISDIELLNVNNGAKVYDGKTNLIIKSRNIQGIVDTDDVRIQELTCTASSKNVGQGIALTYNVVLAGNDKDSYSYQITNSPTTINITPLAISLNGVKATDRPYDKTANVVVSGGSLSGAIVGDDVSFNLNASATIADINAGSNKTVTYTADLTGADAANYTLQQSRVSVNITKVSLSATWGNTTFVYNKTQHVPTVTISGVLDGDSVSAKAVYNDAENDGINVAFNSGYIAGIILEGNDKDNYIVKDNFTATVTIIPIVAEIEFFGDNVFIANIPSPTTKPIGATVVNALDDDQVNCILSQHTANRPGRHTAQVLRLDNQNYTLEGATTPITKDYIVRTSSVVNFATTAKKLSIDIIDYVNGFDPDAMFFVEKIDTTSAVFAKLKKEEKIYASYKVRMAIQDTPVELNGTYKYQLYVPNETTKEAKYVKVALYDGASVKELTLEIKDEIVTFEATNLLEITVVVAYAPIFVWLWAVLGILGVIAVIVIIWMLIFYLGKRKLLFDPNGGEPVEGIAGKFHQEIMLPETARTAHIFNGWFKDKKFKKAYNSNNLPFWDTVLVAKWLDADGVPTPYVPGSTILPAARVAMAEPKLDNEIDAQNQAVVRTITLDTRGGLPIPPITAIKGAKIELPIPNKANDAFVGWYQDDKLKSEAFYGVMPKKSVTIYAKWASDRDIAPENALTIKVDKSDKTRTLTFDTRGGNVMEPIVAVKKSKIEVAEPKKVGETFAYWSTDSKDFKKIILNTMPVEDTKVYAIYSGDLNPVGVAITEEAKRNEALNEPIESKPFNPQQFSRVVGVPSEVDDKIDALMFGSAVMPSNRLVDQIVKEEKPRPEPVVETRPKAIIQPVVKEEKQSLQEKLLVKAVLFNTRGGSQLKPLQAKMGTPIDLPTPIKGESRFLGWFKDESLLKPCDFTKMPSKNTMLFAKWIEDATVQELFDSGLTDAKSNKAFDDDQAQIDRLFADDKGKGMDDIVIQRTSTKKSSMIVDDRKKGK